MDGSYYLFRAYYGLPGLTNARREPTGAIYGVVNMLRKLLRDERPDYFAVVFDTKEKSFRNALYPEYKANRPPPPDDLVCQIEPLHEIICALGVPLLLIEGVEADDVIATLATTAARAGMRIVISTGDKDLAQIVDDDIHLFNTMNNARYDPAGVLEKYGVPPERIVDYLALVGDASDNVPGIPKVGPKTAVKWLGEHGSLDAIVKNAGSFTGKVGSNLREHLAQIPLSKQLVTLKTDVPLDLGPEQLLIGAQDKAKLKEHYHRWGFRSWLPEINGGPAATLTQADAIPAPAPELAIPFPAQQARAESDDAPKYQTLRTVKELERWVDKLAGADLFAFDTETNSLDCMQAELVGLSFSVRTGEAAYVPLAHDYEAAPRQISRRKALEKLRPLLESDAHKKVGQNLKYDKNVLANYDIALNGIAHDSMLQSYVLDSVRTRHDMASLAGEYLDKSVTRYEDIAGKGAKQIPFNQVPVEQAAAYAAEDADIALQLHQTLWPKLEADAGLKALYTDIEMPLLGVIAQMERNGVIIDADMLRRQSQELDEQMRETEEQACREAGQSFNIASPKQIQTILYDKMQLPVLAKTPKGQPSTAESVLQALAVDHELPQLILQHRGLSKLKSTYTDRLPEQVNPVTGRIHTSYHQAVTATGRLSSSDPNLQNIPIRTEEGRKIRRAFRAAPGKALLAADYSQIELRIMAHLSGDDALLAAFQQGKDIHRATAAEVFAVDLNAVSAVQRRAAKAINFGLIYGMSAFGLAKQLGISRTAAKQYIDTYFERYPAVKRYMDSTRARAKETGCVETVFKRRLSLPDINARDAARRNYAERTAINAPMQGTAADIIKRAMIAIDEQLLQRDQDIRMIMQVHDELVLEVAEAKIDACREALQRLMSGAATLSVPLIVEVGVGDNWDEAH